VFNAARVGVGALGVLTDVTLQCTDAFILRADERPGTVGDAFASLDEHIESNDHFEMYWFPYTDRVQLKRNNRVPVADQPLSSFRGWLDDSFLSNTVFGGVCRVGRAVPALVPTFTRVASRALSARVYTAPSHEVFCTPRKVRFTEMEYGLPREALPEAFAACGNRRRRAVQDRVPGRDPVHRCRRHLAVARVWAQERVHRDPPVRRDALRAVHEGVREGHHELGGRPHWGKLNWRDADSLRTVYPRFDDFLAVRDQLDPQRTFANEYTRRIFGS